MGENPDNDNFILGGTCVDCEIALFPNGTPKYILMSVSGMEACPPWPGPVPNGSWLLTQSDPDTCVWFLTTADFLFSLFFGTIYGFAIDDLATGDELFLDLSDGPCSPEFENQFDDCSAGDREVFGTAIASWGPSIHP